VGPGALELVEGFVPLCHDVVEGVGDSVMAIGQCQGALEPCALRALGSGMALGSD